MRVQKRSSWWALGFALLALSSIFTAFSATLPAHAFGEKYSYAADGSIRIEGGALALAGKLDKQGDSKDYSGGITIINQPHNDNKCDFALTITVDAANDTKGSIKGVELSSAGLQEGCPQAYLIKQERLTNPITISKPVSTNPNPIPDGCPGSKAPANPPPPVCATIPPGCPGSTQSGPLAPNANCPYGDGTVTKDDQETVKCSAESSFSWILCPILEMAIKGSEMAANAIDGFLAVSPLTIDGDTKVIYGVWDNIRNVANILLVIVMFALIFSQATSVGIGAYGVKKMLPKLIAAAVLANLSFFICSFAVDVFNVLGGGIRQLVESATTVPIGTITPATEEGGVQGFMAQIFSNDVVQGIAATAAGIVIILSPIWATVLIALLVALLTLAARQAVIIMLVIAAPVAFVLWVLPNTEKYFKKWGELFLTTLMMYPLIMLMFAGSRLAASVLAGNGSGDEIDQTLALSLAILVAFVWLIALPATVKVGGMTLGALYKRARGSAAGKKASEFEAGMRDRVKGRLARNYDPMLNRSNFEPGDEGEQKFRRAQRKNAVARIVTGNIIPGARSRAQTKKVAEDYLESEVGLASNRIEDMKFSKDTLTKAYGQEKNFYTRYAIAKQLANLGAGEKLGGLMETEAAKSNPDMQSLAILSRAVNDKHELKNSHHQVFFKAAGMQKAFSEGKSNSAEVVKMGNDLAAKKAIDDMGADMLITQSPDGIKALTSTFERLAVNDPNGINEITQTSNRQMAQALRAKMGDDMHTIASQERLLPRLSGARDDALKAAESFLNIGAPGKPLTSVGNGSIDYTSTLANTKSRSGGTGGGGGTP